MPKPIFVKKVSFLPYFPYGFCSRLATNIEGMNRFASLATTLNIPGDYEDTETFEQASKSNYTNKVRRSKALCDRKQARNARRKCGTPIEERSFRFLTKKGLNDFLYPPDGTTAEMEITEPNDGNKKGILNCDSLGPCSELRTVLTDLASSDSTEDQKAFSNLLLKAVMHDVVTPLSYAMPLAPDVDINATKYSQNQTYNIWRLSHVYAMFRANGHLTNLDRRPGCPDYSVDGICNDVTYEKYLLKNGHTPASITYYALSRWYNEHPDFYTFTQTEPSPDEAAKARWLNTPAFYDVADISLILNKNKATKTKTIMGNSRTLYSIAMGLALGKNCNYVCYHSKTEPFKWLSKRESLTKAELEQAVREMKTINTEIQSPISVDYGLYFCASAYQFEALFEKTIQQHKEKRSASFPTDTPFISLHTIPVNDSGTFLLWCLMETSPIETEKRLCNTLVSWDIGFEHSTNYYYPLLYQGRRVFPGHTMDVGKINRVLVDYLNGEKFYISCFPEQVVYYRRLFPDLPFL